MAEPETYYVLDEGGEIVNAVLWDGSTEWSPGQSREVLRHADLPKEAREKGVGIGWERKPGGKGFEDLRPDRPEPATPA